MNTASRLRDLATTIRSKNSGPFEVTFDIIFKDTASFQLARSSGVLTKELVAELYDVPSQTIQTFIFFEPLKCLKFTIPRQTPQGGPGERDMHAAQQYAPLLDIMI